MYSGDHALEAVETGRELKVARIYRVTGERHPVTQRDELVNGEL